MDEIRANVSEVVLVRWYVMRIDRSNSESMHYDFATCVYEITRITFLCTLLHIEYRGLCPWHFMQSAMSVRLSH